MDVTVEIATEEDCRVAIANELAAAGVTSMDELREMAHSDSFPTERARRAWFAVAPIGEYSC